MIEKATNKFPESILETARRGSKGRRYVYLFRTEVVRSACNTLRCVGNTSILQYNLCHYNSCCWWSVSKNEKHHVEIYGRLRRHGRFQVTAAHGFVFIFVTLDEEELNYRRSACEIKNDR